MLFLRAILIANSVNGDEFLTLRGQESQAPFPPMFPSFLVWLEALSASSDTSQPMPSGAGCHS